MSVVLELENNEWGDLNGSWLPTGACVCMYVCVCVLFVHVCMYDWLTCMDLGCLQVCVCMYVCMYVCGYVCM